VDFKGNVSQDFLLQVFIVNYFTPGTQKFAWRQNNFFQKFVKIFTTKGAPSMTPAAK
jgi:hypothetical protein